MSKWIDVAKTDELPPGERRVVEVEGVLIAVFNLRGEYFAIEDTCSHDGGELASGEVKGDEIICPRHGARFCIKTGEATALPALQSIATFPVQVANGVVQVTDDRRDV